ncbi:MAG: 7TM-DISM domain-containing protein [Oligoflexus sp.]
MRPKIFVVVLIFFAIIFSGFSKPAEASCYYQQTEKGVIDLRSWNFQQCPYLRMSGEYHFFWRELLSATEVKQRIQEGHSEGFAIPGVWYRKRYQKIFMDITGFATYYTKVLLPEVHPETLTFYLWEQPTAVDIWVDGESILQLGKVGKNIAGELADRRPNYASFKVPSRSFDVVFHVSNFHLGIGGFWHIPLLGEEENLWYFIRQLMVVEAFGIGAVLFISLYYLILWFFQRDQRSYFYFATFGVLIFVRGLFSGSEKLFQYLYPVSFEWGYRIEYCCFYVIHYCIVLFIHHLFRDAYSKIMLRLVQFSVLSFTSMTILTEPAFFTQFLGYYQVLWVFSFLYLLLPYWQGKWRGSQGAMFFVLSCLIPFTAGLHDVFINHSPVGIPLFSHGLAVAMLMHASVLSKRFTSTFEQLKSQEALNRDLSQKMNTQNQEFQRREAYRQFYQKLTYDEVQRAIDRVRESLTEFSSSESREKLICPLELYSQTLMGHASLDASRQKMAQSYLAKDFFAACQTLILALSEDNFKPSFRVVSDQDLQYFSGEYWHWLGAVKLVLIGLKQSLVDAQSQVSLILELKNQRLVMELAVKPLHISERRKESLIAHYAEAQAELEFLSQTDPFSRSVFLARRIVQLAGGDFHILTNRSGETKFSLVASLNPRGQQSILKKSA